ncbi:hypothetical protein GOL39_32520 [Sinorhizobium medicae]|nr:hypothetical protein [Sinorhizobium medicae]MDX0439760.1 hypothetical protein [Sinorhizobium medicae]MDX0470282.1 hypothetical protein [Sinorhizobium medicae]MDX0653818.1 hypothetical protein [Sinorhizobium medicae]MDX0716105.1 hypothetical protein [Sinorhizobium medicae]
MSCSGSTRAAPYAPLQELSTSHSFLIRSRRNLLQVNIEDAVVAGQELRLFQRGNKRHIDNAVIRYPPSAVLNGQFHDTDCDRAVRSRCHPTLGVAAFDPGRQRLSMKVVKLEPPDYTSSASL